MKLKLSAKKSAQCPGKQTLSGTTFINRKLSAYGKTYLYSDRKTNVHYQYVFTPGFLNFFKILKKFISLSFSFASDCHRIDFGKASYWFREIY